MSSTVETKSPAGPSTDQAGMTAVQSGFMASLAVHLGLAPSDGVALIAPHHLVGPSGLVCRVALHPDRPAVRLLTLLPMSPIELFGTGVDVLLAVQGELLNSLGWYLGRSDEGLLQLDTMTWLDDAARAAAELDRAHGVGVAVMHTLLRFDSEPAGKEQGT